MSLEGGREGWKGGKGGGEGGRLGREGGREGREGGRWEGGEGEGGRDDCYTYSNRYVQFFYRNVLFVNSDMMHILPTVHVI